MDAIERRLSSFTTASTVSSDSSTGRESLLSETFDRPVAIGYRSVRMEFAKDESQ
jgi:hypothetical protein